MINFDKLSSLTDALYSGHNQSNKLTHYVCSDSVHQELTLNNLNLNRLGSLNTIQATLLHRTSATPPMFATSNIKLNPDFMAAPTMPGVKLRVILRKDLDVADVAAEYQRTFMGLPISSAYDSQKLEVIDRSAIEGYRDYPSGI